MISQPTLKKIQETYNALKPIVKHTPLIHSKSFSDMAGCNVYLKLENLQSTGSFKIRGAYNKIRLIKDTDKRRRIVCASAGNHAQGVAFAATKAGIKSTIYMPAFSSPLKVIATKSYGGEIVLSGVTFDESYKLAREYEKQSNAIFIPPFDDNDVIAGQGTIGIELLQDLDKIDAVIIPIGGGGLISGIAISLKEINPKIKIYGVEAEGAAAMQISIKENKLKAFPKMNTIADGIAVKTPGNINYDIVKKYVDDIVTVSDHEISLAVYYLLQRAKSLTEPAGATSLAAVLFQKIKLPGKNVVCINSGGNIKMDLLQQILEKSLLENNLRMKIELVLPDMSGKLNEVITVLDKLRANVHEIVHDRNTATVPVGFVKIIVSFHVQQEDQMDQIKSELKKRKLKYKILK